MPKVGKKVFPYTAAGKAAAGKAATAKYRKDKAEGIAKSRASRATKKMRDGGRVENGHDVTDARGSGAARTQRFKKNG
jgi:hypothetical protein|tara:strand:+ start:42 stop:275 length:234 start_codon:yes stop_codon:yes gene_type:complete